MADKQHSLEKAVIYLQFEVKVKKQKNERASMIDLFALGFCYVI
jgi:hypothetical protein